MGAADGYEITTIPSAGRGGAPFNLENAPHRRLTAQFDTIRWFYLIWGSYTANREAAVACAWGRLSEPGFQLCLVRRKFA